MKDYLCVKCEEKNPENFYTPCKNLCKICYKKRANENRAKKIDYYREYDRKRSWLPHRIKKREEIANKWKKDPALKKRSAELKKSWQLKNKIKHAAHVIVGNAIAKGKLKKEPCKICGDIKVDAHHDDYSKPLDIVWLCRKHHAEYHKELREKSRTFENDI